MGAEIVSGIDTIIKMVNLKEDLKNADWIITGEGKFDLQSLRGKVICGIAKLAQQTGTKTAVIAGDVNLTEEAYSAFGISNVICLRKKPMTTEYSMLNGEKLLKNAVKEFVRKTLLQDSLIK
jgi:glycerate kinase